jgi:transposase
VSPEPPPDWYRRAELERSEGRPGELTSAECEELKRLRKRNAEKAKTIEAL